MNQLDQKRYEFVTAQIRYHNEKMIEAFKLYITLLSAIVGSVFWVLAQSEIVESLKYELLFLIPWLVITVSVSVSILILSNYVAWWGYRKAESKITKGAVPQPVLPKSFISQAVMLVVIIISCFGFWIASAMVLEAMCKSVPRSYNAPHNDTIVVPPKADTER
ncbi:MAG: hypothetical protein HY083_10920 [Gammaproteobacteria bacterium]|nr:hypothetical protein [Gammaproteobacteria bacterium]